MDNLSSISEVFIRRPVMTTLLMAAIVLAGLFGYATLPVSELPSVDFPTISVSASLPGADPQTMAASVATPLENQFSTIAGLDSMVSQSAQGSVQITLQFRLDRNIDAAAQDVQTAIAGASRQLPLGMPSPPSFRKVNPSDAPIFFLALASDSLPLSTVDEYAETLIARKLSTINGVAQVNIWGQQHRAIRIQLDPDALAARGIGIDQVTAAVQHQNSDDPTGTLEGTKTETMVHANSQLMTAEAYKNQIIAYRDGMAVRLGDVANVIDSVENNKVASTFNGKPTIVLNVQRQPGANTIQVVDAIKAALPHIEDQLPRSIKVNVEHDRSVSIRASVRDVQITLLTAAALVVGVIFLFLRTVSATFIPSIALPIAVIGTFAGMALMGYSLDNLSLLALTLSVGFVVDDAIVMLENIVRHTEEGEEPFHAALVGAKEIAFTILSMTVSLAAVFIPVLFMGGIVGRLLHEMAVTIVIAIAVSGVVSITLTPMLCSRLLKPGHHTRPPALFAPLLRLSEATFASAQRGYETSLAWSLSHRRFILGIFFATIAATIALFDVVPKDFIPSQDNDQLNIFTEARDGTSFADMRQLQAQVNAILMADPNIDGVTSAVGAGGVRAASNSGNFTIHLKSRDERKLTADAVITELRAKLIHIPGINVYIQNPPVIRVGAGQSKGAYQYVMQGLDRDDLFAAANRMDEALKKQPGFVDVATDLDLAGPSVNVAIDRDRAAALGVSAQKIDDALGSAFGGEQISTIYADTDQFKVMLELLPKYQADPSSLSLLYVSSDSGNLLPLTAFTKITNGSQAVTENHVGQLPSVTVSFNLAQGVPLSQAVSEIQQTERAIDLPASVQTSFAGTAQAFETATTGLGWLLLGAVLVVYIVLGILYESFVHPLTILSGLPAAAVGALLTLWAFGVPLSLYAFVGIIMLVGIVKKNAIMMIDFALHKQREEGVDAETAIAEAAVVRFRPIMMTTMAALMGTLPIAVGLGAGGDARQPLGLAVVGGLVLSQMLTLYITPVLYGYFDRIGMRLSSRRKKPVRVHMPAE